MERGRKQRNVKNKNIIGIRRRGVRDERREGWEGRKGLGKRNVKRQITKV